MKQGLKKQTIANIVFPLLVMTVVLVIVAVLSNYNSVTAQIEGEMKRTAEYVMGMYDKMYPGDFDVTINENTGIYTVKKGSYDISNDYDMIDSVATANGVGITIFCKNIRVLTNMLDENNKRYIDSKVATQVENDVLKGREEHFYNNVKLNNEAYYAYYAPIYQADGTVFGMIGVVRSAKDATKLSRQSILPMVTACILCAVFVAFVILSFTSKVAKRIRGVEGFMKKVAEGDFNNDMPKVVMEKDDEIKSLASSGRTMQSSISQLVEYDALTKLHNRRFGDKKLKEVIEQANNTGTDFCVAIGDIDFFKKVNDTYGHDAGDVVLIKVAEQLAKGMAGNGFVARWGGEEFLMVFRMKTLDESVAVMEGILDNIRALDIEAEGYNIKVTMSMGVTAGVPDKNADEQLKKADDNLYYAKEHGRNQIRAV